MNVGIFAGRSLADPRAGGGYTVQYSLINALSCINSHHQFYLFCDDERLPVLPNISVFPLSHVKTSTRFLDKCILKVHRSLESFSVARGHKSYLNRAVHNHNIDLMWFATPSHQYVDVPYIYTVWDLQHRLQSYFPEVSVSGSTFQQREANFTSVIQQAAYVVIGNQAGKDEIARFYGMPNERIKIIPLPTPDFALEYNDIKLDLPKMLNLQKPFLFYPAQFWRPADWSEQKFRRFFERQTFGCPVYILGSKARFRLLKK